MLYSPLIERALRLTATAHASQVRKGTAIPYVTHLAGTALVLARAGFINDELLAAALLHDCLEDAGISAGQIERDFGPAVAAMVIDASEIKHGGQGEKLPWNTRKEEHLARLATCPVESRAIVLADKIHNLGTLADDLAVDPNAWTRFNAAPRQTLWYYEAMFELAHDEPRLQVFSQTGSELLERLRAEFPENQE